MEQNNFPKMIIVHHTGGTDKNPLADTSNHTLAIIRESHKARGFYDPASKESVGYHWFIDKKGNVAQGRPECRNGAHTTGYNTKSIGICLAGNFDATLPTESQIQALTTLLKEVMKRYSIPASEIYPHRKFTQKTCCGLRLSDTWASELAVKDSVKNTTVVLGEYDIAQIKQSIANKEVNGLFQFIKKLFKL